MKICADCGAALPAGPNRQKYCAPCSSNRDGARKLAWSRRNKPAPISKAARAAEKIRRLELVRKPSTPSVTWMAEAAPDLSWLIRLRVPFSYSLSKNAVWSMSGNRGHVFMRKKASLARASVRDAMAAAIAQTGVKPVEAKVYIDIFVQKPNHRGDAINVIDSVCDGLKEALGVDDRWFCIRRLDWEIQAINPLIVIGVGQVEKEHHRPCSACGQIRPLTDFGSNKRVRLGRSRECRDCARALDTHRRNVRAKRLAPTADEEREARAWLDPTDA